MTDMEVKKCCRCGRILPISEFDFTKWRKTKRLAHCRECMVIYKERRTHLANERRKKAISDHRRSFGTIRCMFCHHTATFPILHGKTWQESREKSEEASKFHHVNGWMWCGKCNDSATLRILLGKNNSREEEDCI